MKKLVFFLFSSLMALLSCYALFWMTRSYLATIEDRFANAQSFQALGIVEIGAPFFLFFAQLILLSIVYGLSVHHRGSEPLDWGFIVGGRGPKVLNGFKVVLAAFLLFVSWRLLNYEAIPLWCSLIVTVTMISYGAWMLQLIKERLPG